jgi:hypothetical protein
MERDMRYEIEEYLSLGDTEEAMARHLDQMDLLYRLSMIRMLKVPGNPLINNMLA